MMSSLAGLLESMAHFGLLRANPGLDVYPVVSDPLRCRFCHSRRTRIELLGIRESGFLARCRTCRGTMAYVPELGAVSVNQVPA